MKNKLCKKGDRVVIKTGGWTGFYGTVATTQLTEQEVIEIQILAPAAPVITLRRSDVVIIDTTSPQTAIPETSPSVTVSFRSVCSKITSLYERKNADYGDSFSRSVHKYGNIAALTRISDKFNRMENLLLKDEQKVTDESLKDTVLDLASYAIMFYMELMNK